MGFGVQGSEFRDITLIAENPRKRARSLKLETAVYAGALQLTAG